PDLVPVAGMEGGGQRGVRLRQQAPQVARAVGRFLLAQLPPQAPVGRRSLPQAVSQSANVQTRPAHAERDAPSRMSPGGLLPAQPASQADIEWHIPLDV